MNDDRTVEQHQLFDEPPPFALRVLACARPGAALGQGFREAARARLPASAEITRLDRLHLTLMAWPSLHPDLLTPLQEQLSRILFSPIALSFDRLDVWPGNRIAALLPVDPDPLSLLFAQVRAASRLAGIGHEQGRSPDLPHVTLSRNAPVRAARHEIAPFAWRLSAFELVISPRYSKPYVPLGRFAAQPG